MTRLVVLTIGFILAVLCHVGYKWLGYFTKHRENTFTGYWKEYWPMTVQGFGVDVVIYGLHYTGLLAPVGRWFSETIVGVPLPTDMILPTTAYIGMQFWTGVGLGLFAESFGKTFLPAIVRFATASVNKVLSALPKSDEKETP